MSPEEELAYLKRVCEEARLCISCKHFSLLKIGEMDGDCDVIGMRTDAYDCEDTCDGKWERRPEPWESETCGTCLHFAKFAQKTVLWNNCWIKSTDPNSPNIIVTVSKEQKACPDWRKNK